MPINLIIFGQLCEVLGESLVLNDVSDTNNLVATLNEKYPELIHSKYIIAVNKKVVTENVALPQHCTVALLPPYSGG